MNAYKIDSFAELNDLDFNIEIKYRDLKILSFRFTSNLHNIG